ncbi:alkaline phosphatase family protein [Kitasatospora sp. NPDC101183]|uniref:alkaline phosphatase family protein n=1 Tax=Kitasatospora sp. NPDC101183 TaxID=3364100 RepID=UPI00381DFE32
MSSDTPKAAPALPASLLEAMNRKPRPGGLKAIRHVVFLMQENRSFDHYFGSNFRGVRGFADRNLVKLAGPGDYTVLQQPDQDHPGIFFPPYRLRPEEGTAGPKSHDWGSGHEAWHNGHHDRWYHAKWSRCMGYFDQEEVVGTYRTLADCFTVCDAYHSSVMGETTSNRNYLFTGYGGYEPDGKRVTGSAAHDREDSTSSAFSPAGYDWKSYPEILEGQKDPFGADGISWRVYQGWNNFYDNNLEFHAEFKRIFQAVLDKARADNPHLNLHYQSLFEFYDRPRKGKADWPAVTQAEVEALAKAAAAVLSPADQILYDRGLFRYPSEPDQTKNPNGYTDFVYAFWKDVNNGTVPRVSYLVPSDTDSEHPGDSGPTDGEGIVRQVLEVISSNSEMWDSTVLFISYDENDGFFDHVPPPVPPQTVENKKDEYVGDQPIGLGIRVPMITVSPWTVGGFVNSQVFDHTSQVRFLEKWLGVKQDLISPWRRTVAGDLTSVFDFDRTGDEPQQALVPDRRPARPLPYQADAHGVLSHDTGTFLLRMANTGTASAHLTLYSYHPCATSDECDAPQHFDVLGTAVPSAKVPVKDGTYDLVVTGPNGFRREFGGDAKGAAAELDVTSVVSPAPKRTVTVTITSPNSQSQAVTLTPRYYSSAKALGGDVVAGTPLVLTWDAEDAKGWYDLDLSVTGDKSFRRRLMGHVENGRPSISG